MANMSNIYILLIFGLTWTFAHATTPIRQCADENVAMPLMVQINDCDSSPCDLLKDSEANIAIQFVANRNSMRQLSAQVHLTSLGVTIPYDLEASRGNVCSNLLHGAYCPLDDGEDVTYQLLLPIASSQPEVPTRLEVKLVDDQEGNVIACFLADTRIKKPNSS